MNIKISVYIATSVDGYISRPDGTIDWLDCVSGEEDTGFEEFMSGIDCMVMGRNTFEQVLSFGEWAYGDVTMKVLTRKGVEIPESLRATVSATSQEPAEIVRELAAAGRKHAYIDGGQTIQSFLRAGLITDLSIFRLPILLGEGKPLFAELNNDVLLRLTKTHGYKNGIVETRYDVQNT